MPQLVTPPVSVDSVYLAAIRAYLLSNMGFAFDSPTDYAVEAESPKGLVKMGLPADISPLGYSASLYQVNIGIFIAARSTQDAEYLALDWKRKLQVAMFELENYGTSGVFRGVAVNNILKGIKPLGQIQTSDVSSSERQDLSDRSVQSRVVAQYTFRLEYL